MSFLSVLESVGKDFAKGLKFAVTYAVPAEKLVALLFPSTAPGLAAVTERDYADPECGAAGGAEVCGQRRAGRDGGAEAGGGVDADRRCGDDAVAAKSGITVTPDYLEKLVEGGGGDSECAAGKFCGWLRQGSRRGA